MKAQSQLFSFPVKPVNERFPGQNGGRCHGDVGFGARSLLDNEFKRVPAQRTFNDTRIGELIG